MSNPFPEVPSATDFVRQRVDLSLVKPEVTYTQVYRLCKKVRDQKYRAAVIPSTYLETFKNGFEDIKLVTVVNYPYGLHSSDVVLREIQGVVGLCEDISNIEIEAVCPRDMHFNFDLLTKWNHLIPIRLILPFYQAGTILERLPTNKNRKYPIVQGVTLIIPQTFDTTQSLKVMKTVSKLAKKAHALGYQVKLAGALTWDNRDAVEPWLDDWVQILGLQQGVNVSWL